MEFTKKIILIIFLIIILLILFFNKKIKENNFENFETIKENNKFYQSIKDIKKSKIIKKSKSNDKKDYNELEVKIPSTNPLYEKLNKFIKKYNVNLLYNLQNINPNLPLVITYDNQSLHNDKNESFINFLKGLTHYKYNFIVCGINTKWDGWYGRYKIYLELLENIPSEQLIFVTDSRDVLVNDSPEEFVKNYNNIIKIYNDVNKNKIIFGTEIGCCVNQMWHYSPGVVFKNIDDNKISEIKNNISKNIIDKIFNVNNKIFNVNNKIFNVNNKIFNISNKISNENNINQIILTNQLNKIEIEENISEYNLHPTYSLVRDANKIFPNGKDYPWDNWIKWNNIFKERLIEAIKKYNLHILDENYPLIKLNFGMMVGTNENILKMLKLFDLRTGEDDQHLASEFFYMRPEMVILDYTQILLSNTGYKHSFRKCTSKTMNNQYYNINFNDHLNDHDEYIDMNVYTREDIPEQGIMYGFDIEYLKYFFTYDSIINYPCFIQSPGKDWNCYNELLYRLPYCDDKMCSYYYNLEQTQKYNIRDIIFHEYKNQNGHIKIEWIITNILNPLYWALNLYIVKDIFDIINNKMKNSNTIILVDSGNLLGYYRFKNLDKQHIMPWDDDFNLGWYSSTKFSKEIIETFFKHIIKQGYEIFLYYKEIYTQYSSSEKDHFTIKLNSENILQISNLLSRYEIVLFNLTISENKYSEILKIFNMDFDYEEKYIDGKIKIPSVDIFMYEFNNLNKSYEYNKLFGVGYTISLPENVITPVKDIKYNILDLNIPNNINKYLELVYITNYSQNYKDLDMVIINKHVESEDKKNEIKNFNKLHLSVKDINIILITKIYNNFINKYFEIIKSNETIKKIIST
jgi:hypothetical protein